MTNGLTEKQERWVRLAACVSLVTLAVLTTFVTTTSAALHLLVVFIIALVATGAYEVQQQGMILEKLGKFWHRKVNSSFYEKPLWTCPICMVSVWGIPAALIVAPHLWMYLPLYLFASAGLAAYLNK